MDLIFNKRRNVSDVTRKAILGMYPTIAETPVKKQERGLGKNSLFPIFLCR